MTAKELTRRYFSALEAVSAKLSCGSPATSGRRKYCQLFVWPACSQPASSNS